MALLIGKKMCGITTDLYKKSEVSMDYIIRELKQEEINILDTFLYEAIFIPEGVESPSKK